MNTCLGEILPWMRTIVLRYAFEAVEGDTVSTITPSEHDGGYSLNYEARSTAGNQSKEQVKKQTHITEKQTNKQTNLTNNQTCK